VLKIIDSIRFVGINIASVKITVNKEHNATNSIINKWYSIKGKGYLSILQILGQAHLLFHRLEPAGCVKELDMWLAASVS